MAKIKVVYIKAGMWGDFIFQDDKIIPCKYGDFQINKEATEQDIEVAKQFMEQNKLTCESVELLEINQ